MFSDKRNQGVFGGAPHSAFKSRRKPANFGSPAEEDRPISDPYEPREDFDYMSLVTGPVNCPFGIDPRNAFSTSDPTMSKMPTHFSESSNFEWQSTPIKAMTFEEFPSPVESSASDEKPYLGHHLDSLMDKYGSHYEN